MKNIKYYARRNYGTLSYYLVDKEQHQLVNTLTRRSTVTQLDLKALSLLLGHPDKPCELEHVPDPELAVV